MAANFIIEGHQPQVVHRCSNYIKNVSCNVILQIC